MTACSFCQNPAEWRLTPFAAVCSPHLEWLRGDGYQWTVERITDPLSPLLEQVDALCEERPA